MEESRIGVWVAIGGVLISLLALKAEVNELRADAVMKSELEDGTAGCGRLHALRNTEGE